MEFWFLVTIEEGERWLLRCTPLRGGASMVRWRANISRLSKVRMDMKDETSIVGRLDANNFSNKSGQALKNTVPAAALPLKAASGEG